MATYRTPQQSLSVQTETQEQEHGYDVELASGEPVDNKYMCPVCLSVMRDAMQTVCGHRFCKACITRITGDRPWGKCPVDKTNLRRPDELFNDVAMRREILSLYIKCKNNSENCTWTGELRDAVKHLGECLMESVTCPVGCEKTLLRVEIAQHRDECPQRQILCIYCQDKIVLSKIHKHEVVDCPKFPICCTLCGESGIPRGTIARHMDSLTGTCPQANVACKFRTVGCHFQDKRKDIQQHYDNSIESHLSLLMGRVLELTQTNDSLRDELGATQGKLADSSLKIVDHAKLISKLRERTVSGRLLWKVDLSSMQPLPNMVFSPPFYSSCPGYQMRLRLDFRGVTDGDDIYSSVFAVLQKGEFDDDLLFPYTGQIRVTLLSQSNNRNIAYHNISAIVKCRDVPRNVSGNINSRINSRGCTRFLKQKELLAPVYNKNRVLYFDISVVNPSEKSASENTTNSMQSNILVSSVSPVRSS